MIGVGHVGSHHARIYSELQDAELVEVSDISLERGQAIAALYNTSSTADYRSLLDNVQAVSIAVPTINHFEVARDFLNAGVHCLIEKPITTTVKEANQLIKLARKKKLIIQIGHTEQFNPALAAAQPYIDSPRFIEAHRLGPFKSRSLDIGIVLDLMIHDIEIALSLVNSKVKSFEAIGVPVLTKHEDIANARIQFKNGAVCNLTASRLSDKAMRKIRVFQKSAYISLDCLEGKASIYQTIKDEVKAKELEIPKQDALTAQLKSFLNSIHNKTHPIVTAEQGRNALELALAITRKIHKK